MTIRNYGAFANSRRTGKMNKKSGLSRSVRSIWIGVGASALVLTSATIAFSAPTVSPTGQGAIPAAKAKLIEAEQAQQLAGRANAAPKSEAAAPQAQALPSLAPISGITNARQAPFPPATFAVQNAWTGEVGGAYYTVFAGVANYGYSGQTPHAGVVLFADPSNVNAGTSPSEVGTFLAGTGSTPLHVTSVANGVVYLADAAGNTANFAVATRSYSK